MIITLTCLITIILIEIVRMLDMSEQQFLFVCWLRARPTVLEVMSLIVSRYDITICHCIVYQGIVMDAGGVVGGA